jgi:hypothetical protein
LSGRFSFHTYDLAFRERHTTYGLGPIMPTQISRAEFETLPESLKGKFTESGDAYVLQEEDVAGLKQSKETILREKKDLEKRFEGIDPDAARKALEELEAARVAVLSVEERHKEAIEKYKADLASERGEKEQVLDGFKRKELELTLLAKGVRKEYIDLAALKVGHQVEVAKGDNGLSLKVRDEIGDFDKLTEGLRGSYPALFESTSASGSGAQPSSGTSSGAKQWTRSQWDAASTADRSEFSRNGGSITD